jgi:Protein of unknown function (DUF3263)
MALSPPDRAARAAGLSWDGPVRAGGCGGDGRVSVGQDEAAAAPDAPAEESAPEFPPQRGPETAAPHRVPAQRPDADADEDRDEDRDRPAGGESEPGAGTGADPDDADDAAVPVAEVRAQAETQAESEPQAQAQPQAQDGSGTSAEAQPPDPATGGLGVRERGVLDFERRRWKHVGAKEQAIRDEFGLSPTHYYQILNALLDDPAALAYRPTLVNRLRRARDAKRRERR